MNSIDHLLSVGATGMLAGTILHLAGSSRQITSIARTTRSLHQLEQQITANLGAPHPNHTLLPLDYQNREHFLEEISTLLQNSPPPDLAVIWMHGPTATNGSVDLARLLGETAGTTDLYHVLGSSGRDLRSLTTEDISLFEEIEGVRYHRVVLGYVEQGDSRRWLTDREIADGVRGAMQAGRGVTIVGRV